MINKRWKDSNSGITVFKGLLKILKPDVSYLLCYHCFSHPSRGSAKSCIEN